MPGFVNRYRSQAVRFEASPGPGLLLSVDSGARKIGIALWAWDASPTQAKLVAAETLSAKDDDELLRVLGHWVMGHTGGGKYVDHQPYTAVEVPKKRRDRRRYYKDIDRLLAFIQRAQSLLGKWTVRLYPEEWKAGVGSTLKPKGKEPHHQRLRKALSEVEASLFDQAGPDGKDAVGIGLFTLGRTGRGGVQFA